MDGYLRIPDESKLTLNKFGKSIFEDTPERQLLSCGRNYIKELKLSAGAIAVISYVFANPTLKGEFDTLLTSLNLEKTPVENLEEKLDSIQKSLREKDPSHSTYNTSFYSFILGGVKTDALF